MHYDRPGRQDRARIRETLHARGDVDRPPEIILAIIQHDGEARPFMDPNFEQQIVAIAPAIEALHRLAHPQCRGNRSIGCRKGCHDGVAGRLDDGTRLRGDNPVEDLEVRSDEVECGQITDLLVELGRAPEIGEQKCQAGDFEPLVDIDRVGA